MSRVISGLYNESIGEVDHVMLHTYIFILDLRKKRRRCVKMATLVACKY